MLNWLALIVALGLVVHRIARFIILDTLIDVWRDRFHGWLLSNPSTLRLKIQELFGCAWCASIWVSAGVVAVTTIFTEVPLPVWTWLASASVSALVWSRTDPA